MDIQPETRLNEPKKESHLFDRITRILIVLLLVAVVSLQGYAFITRNDVSAACHNSINGAVALTGSQAPTIAGMFSDYQKAVYDNPNVDTLYKQIFTANEFEFTTLQLLALQNSALLDVAANCR